MIETAILGGGCFWCLEAVYLRLGGVVSVKSGYAGGHTIDPDYHAVCTGETGHAEVVRIEFDTTKVSFQEILEVFFAIHDPTTPNRQGGDTGTQYRSVILYTDEVQKSIAAAMIAKLEADKKFPDPVVTELTRLEKFYPAEEYHDRYYEKNPYQGYCMMVVRPKVEKFGKIFPDKMKIP